ncbi:hypothetical protein HUW46_00431 [Amycolatopsis sp. CA-230715]|nr:hypothetical protein HUW46_00431 [Amycolatopsis sp. CA-230715]
MCWICGHPDGGGGTVLVVHPGSPQQPYQGGPYQQGGRPQQGYPHQNPQQNFGQPPYGYPQQGQGYPPPKKPKTGLIAGIAAGVVVLVLAVVAIVVFTGDDDEPSQAQPSGPPPAPPKPTAAPDKYTKLPTCQEVASKLPDLPALDPRTARSAPKEGSTYPEYLMSCSFRQETPGASRAKVISVDATMYSTDPRGYPAGTEEATGYFEAGIRNGNEEAKDLGIGDRAAWQKPVLDIPNQKPDCELNVLDGNVRLEVRENGIDDPEMKGRDWTDPVCRSATQARAKKFRDAILGEK